MDLDGSESLAGKEVGVKVNDQLLLFFFVIDPLDRSHGLQKLHDLLILFQRVDVQDDEMGAGLCWTKSGEVEQCLFGVNRRKWRG